MRAPLLKPALAWVAGILAARGAGLGLIESALAALLFFGLTLVSGRCAPRLRRVCLWLCLAAAAAAVTAWTRPPPPPAHAGGSQPVEIQGCVVEPPAFFEEYARFRVEIAPGQAVQLAVASDKAHPLPAIAYGARIAATVRLRPPRRYANPGAFDYRAWLGRRDVFWQATPVRGTGVRTFPGVCGNSAVRAIQRLRAALLDRIDSLYRHDGAARALLRALLIGEAASLRQVWIDDFQRTGTYHALVISGAQVGLLVGLFLLLSRICALPPAWGSAGMTAVAWIYALAAGGEAPVVRAAMGATLMALGRLFHRRLSALNLLCAIALTFLACAPAQLSDASFQLSFLAVAALAALSGPCIDLHVRPWRAAARALLVPARLWHTPGAAAGLYLELRLALETLRLACPMLPERAARRLVAALTAALAAAAALVLSSFVVQVALALPMAIYFHRLSLTGLTANLLVVPLTSAAIPTGFAALATGWTPLRDLAGWCARASAAVVAAHARFEPGFRVPDPPLLLGGAVVLFLALTAVLLVRRPRWAAAPGCAALFSVVFLAAAPAPPRLAPGELELTMLDVGQGDSLFVVFPDRTTLLVDAGGLPGPPAAARRRFDIGEEVVAPYLWRRGLRHLDFVAVTHAHADHMGGLAAIVRSFQPREIWTGVMPAGLRPPHSRALRRGEIRRFGGASLEVLAPSPGARPAPKARNNDSLVLLLRYGRTAFLLTGDIEGAAETGLVQAGLIPPVDVLKVAHHGGKASSTPAFLDAARAPVALLSVGEGNPYSLPSPQALDRLARRRTVLLRTDRAGAVTVRSDGRYVTFGPASN